MAFRGRTGRGQQRPQSVLYENAEFVVSLSQQRYEISRGQISVVSKEHDDTASTQYAALGNLVELSGSVALFACSSLGADAANVIITMTNGQARLRAHVVPRYAKYNATGISMDIVQNRMVSVEAPERAFILSQLLPNRDLITEKRSITVHQIADDIYCRKVRDNESEMVFRMREQSGDSTLAVADAAPTSFGHTIIFPYRHYSGLVDTPPRVLNVVGSAAMEMARRQFSGLETFSGKVETPSRVYINLNFGADAGQTVRHVHAHVRGNIPLRTGGQVRIDLNAPKVAALLSSEEMSQTLTALRRKKQ